MSETASEHPTMIGSTRMKSPTCPLSRARGRKAQIVVSTVETTGQETSSAPRIAASCALIPCSCFAAMFSATTIASSTRIPITMISPNIESRFSETSTHVMIARVPRSETAKPIATQKEMRQFRSSTRVIKTRIPPYAAFRVSRFRRPATNLESSVVVIRVPGGGDCAKRSRPSACAFARSRIVAGSVFGGDVASLSFSFQFSSRSCPLRPATYAFTRSAREMMSWSPTRNTVRLTVGSPS